MNRCWTCTYVSIFKNFAYILNEWCQKKISIIDTVTQAASNKRFSNRCSPIYFLNFLILKNLQYGRATQWTRRNSTMYLCKNWYKYWYLHFRKTYDYQIWQVGTSRTVNLNETNQAIAPEVITSISCGKLKTLYLEYQSTYDHQTWPDGNFSRWAPTHKVAWPFNQAVLRDQVTN